MIAKDSTAKSISSFIWWQITQQMKTKERDPLPFQRDNNAPHSGNNNNYLIKQ